MAQRPLILGCRGPSLSDWERRFFAETEPHGFVQVNGTAQLSDKWDRQVLWDMSINYQGEEEGNRYAEQTYREMDFVLITITPTKMAGWTFP